MPPFCASKQSGRVKGGTSRWEVWHKPRDSAENGSEEGCSEMMNYIHSYSMSIVLHNGTRAASVVLTGKAEQSGVANKTSRDLLHLREECSKVHLLTLTNQHRHKDPNCKPCRSFVFNQYHSQMSRRTARLESVTSFLNFLLAFFVAVNQGPGNIRNNYHVFFIVVGFIGSGHRSCGLEERKLSTITRHPAQFRVPRDRC